MYDPLKLDLSRSDGKVIGASEGDEEKMDSREKADPIVVFPPLTADFHEALVGEYMAAFLCFALETPMEFIYNPPGMALPLVVTGEASGGEEKVDAASGDAMASIPLCTAVIQEAF
jgi:hypothetical protein